MAKIPGRLLADFLLHSKEVFYDDDYDERPNTDLLQGLG
jgi:hypothetical protein